MTEIINTYDQLKAAGGERVAIFKHYGGIREHYVAGWAVARFRDGTELVTDRNARWDDHGAKVFLRGTGAFHVRMAAALFEAQAWVKAQGWYDGPWARNAMGDYVPVDVQALFRIRSRPKKRLILKTLAEISKKYPD